MTSHRTPPTTRPQLSGDASVPFAPVVELLDLLERERPGAPTDTRFDAAPPGMVPGWALVEAALVRAAGGRGRTSRWHNAVRKRVAFSEELRRHAAAGAEGNALGARLPPWHVVQAHQIALTVVALEGAAGRVPALPVSLHHTAARAVAAVAGPAFTAASALAAIERADLRTAVGDAHNNADGGARRRAL